uniref:Uncharacterized protein n=1 Tax=Attheya septentrionalis TaxID=420275 RepID=A0A7S2XQ14_9STRA|mmetsp:Transcript_28374/g.51723  ORF Transcript_28374/g.51723 Transcript_28374/m.51723 type:complete len:300 (+) Transcript_28374:524-1423(+)
MNGLGVTNLWQDVLYDPISGQSDLSLMAAALLGLLPGTIGMNPYPGFLESREEVLILSDEGGRDFTAEILDYYDAVAGRCNIILNLGANRMMEKDYFAIATIHETWHCFHSPLDTSPIDLLKRAIREGVVTYLTSITRAITIVDESCGVSSFKEADLLFWSMKELEAAQDLRTEIIGAFAADRTETDPSKLQEWLVLGKSLSSVPGAPSRSAYYVGWLAVQAYVASLSSPPSSNFLLAKEILDLNDSSEGREEIIQALLDSESLDSESSSAPGAKPDGVVLWLVITVLVVPLCSLLLWS